MYPLFAWFLFIPLFHYVSGKSLKETAVTSFLTGLLGNLLTYGWIGNFGAKVPGGFIVILFFLVPSLSAFMTVKVVSSEFLSQKFPRYKIFIYPSVWIIIDFIQSIGFLAFPWTYIGYSQYPFTPFIQVVSVTGILGINFIMILFNIIMSEYLLNSGKTVKRIKDVTAGPYFNRVAVISLIIAIITVAGFVRLFISSGGGKRLKLSIIQSCISPWENWSGNRFSYLSELKRYTKQSLASDPDLIVWSESATLELISFRSLTGETDEFDRQLKEFVKENNKPLLTGEIGVTVKKMGRYAKYAPQNNAVLLDAAGEVVHTYPKINLVPFGEWFPYEKWFAPVKSLLESFGASEFVPGSRPELFTMQDMKFGALICYEGIFYGLCRKYRNMGADFLVNITNDGWTDTYNGHYQHYSASVFRAIENGIWMVRAGNTGVTAIIDPKGRVTGTIPILRKGYLSGEIDTALNVETFYSKYGDIILYLSLLFIAMIISKMIYDRFFAISRDNI
jgi:apolipoprotein N-acyltransferase